MTRQEILAEIDNARRLLATLRARTPSDRLLEHAEQLLTALRSDVIAQWPLAAPEDADIGRFAVRAFDDGGYPDLVASLVRVDSLIKGRGSSGGKNGGAQGPPPQ
jgi:hypothetical protein